MASIPDTLNYLEDYFDEDDYDLEQLFEDAAEVSVTHLRPTLWSSSSALPDRPFFTCATLSAAPQWHDSV